MKSEEVNGKSTTTGSKSLHHVLHREQPFMLIYWFPHILPLLCDYADQRYDKLVPITNPAVANAFLFLKEN